VVKCQGDGVTWKAPIETVDWGVSWIEGRWTDKEAQNFNIRGNVWLEDSRCWNGGNVNVFRLGNIFKRK